MEGVIDNRELINEERSILLNKDYILLFLGKLVSLFGDSIYNIAVSWYILALTDKAIYMALYLALGKVAYIIMSPFSGVISDKLNRKKIIYGMDFIRGASLVGLALVFYLKLPTTTLMGAIFIITIIVNLCASLFNPTTNAVIPLIVQKKQLTKANSWMLSIESVINIFGILMGAILYAVLGIYIIIIINAASYILSGISETFIRIPKTNVKKEDSEKINFMYEIKEGFKFLRKEKRLYALVWYSFVINFLGVPLYTVYLPYIFEHIINSDTVNYSYVLSSLAGGLFLGSLVFGFTPQKEKIYKTISTSLIIQLIPLFSIGVILYLYQQQIIGYFTFLFSYMLCFVVIGMMLAIIGISCSVFIQKTVPNELLGRVSSILSTLVMAAIPLGILVGGLLADLLPMVIVLGILFISYFASDLFFWFNKETRKL